jgi:excisionase family DNA binding protein
LVRQLITTLPLGDFFTPQQLSAQIGRPVPWVMEAIEAGELPARQVRGEWLISKDALNTYFRRSQP